MKGIEANIIRPQYPGTGKKQYYRKAQINSNKAKN